MQTKPDNPTGDGPGKGVTLECTSWLPLSRSVCKLQVGFLLLGATWLPVVGTLTVLHIVPCCLAQNMQSPGAAALQAFF